MRRYWGFGGGGRFAAKGLGKTLRYNDTRDVNEHATYSIIRRALKLRQALNKYVIRLSLLKDVLNRETFENDYLSNNE